MGNTLTNLLANAIERRVVDRTGLSGRVDFLLKYDWSRPPLEPVGGADGLLPGEPPERVSIFTALQEQLGLKLEPVRAPVEVLIVERVEPLRPN